MICILTVRGSGSHRNLRLALGTARAYWIVWPGGTPNEGGMDLSSSVEINAVAKTPMHSN